jgi:hypothetical protein
VGLWELWNDQEGLGAAGGTVFEGATICSFGLCIIITIIIIIILIMLYVAAVVIVVVSRQSPFLPSTPLEPTMIPTTEASSFTLQHFLHYCDVPSTAVFCSEYIDWMRL